MALPPPHKPRRILTFGAVLLAVETLMLTSFAALLAFTAGPAAGHGLLLVSYAILGGTLVSIAALAYGNRRAYFFGENGLSRFSEFLFDWFDVTEITLVPNIISEPVSYLPGRGSPYLSYLFAQAISYRASIAFTLKGGSNVLVHVDPDELSDSGVLALLVKASTGRNPAIRVDARVGPRD